MRGDDPRLGTAVDLGSFLICRIDSLWVAANPREGERRARTLLRSALGAAFPDFLNKLGDGEADDAHAGNSDADNDNHRDDLPE